MKHKIEKSESMTMADVRDIEQSFNNDGFDTFGMVEYSNRLGFVRAWWCIRDVSIENFGALDRIKNSIIPTKYTYGFDYEFTKSKNASRDEVYLHFLIPVTDGSFASMSNGEIREPIFESTKKMKKSQYNVGDYFVNDEGCKVQVTDLFRMDGNDRDMVEWTISYNSNGRAVTFTTMDVFEKMLSDKGARYGGNSSFEPIIRGDEDLMQSTKKSIPNIHDMIAQTRANNNSLSKSRVDLKKEYTDRDKYDDIEYMSMACFEELQSLFQAFNEHHPGSVDFKCNPDEYYQKLVECKKNCDWLIDNVSFITRL